MSTMEALAPEIDSTKHAETCDTGEFVLELAEGFTRLYRASLTNGKLTVEDVELGKNVLENGN